jgi:hypothetical protein
MEKKQLVKFNLILRIEYIMIKKVTKEAFGGQHIDSQNPLTKERSIKLTAISKTLYPLLMNLMNFTFWTCRNKTKLQQKKLKKSTIASKLKSVETADSMTSNQIIAKVKNSTIKITSFTT